MKPQLLIGGVGLVRGRIKGGGGPAIVEVCDHLNPLLAACRWLEAAPFDTVHLILRFGKARQETEIRPVDKRHSELPVARELAMPECEERSRSGELFGLFLTETTKALRDVSEMYELSTEWDNVSDS